MDNYEAFKGFLDNEKFKYDEKQLGNGDWLVRIPQKIQNDAIVNVVFLLSKFKIKVAILGIATSKEEEKKLALYDLFNKFNMEYAFFKMYMRPDGGICVDADFALEFIKGEFQPKELMRFAAMAMHSVGKYYPDIIKIQSA